jgi:septal ring factor EnvC (AmiA/AmiB activator)
MVAEPIGTYGLTVIIQHGGGDYSVYGSLSRADVQKGQQVIKGQVIGAVGVSDPGRPTPPLRDPSEGPRDRSTRLAARRAE